MVTLFENKLLKNVKYPRSIQCHCVRSLLFINKRNSKTNYIQDHISKFFFYYNTDSELGIRLFHKNVSYRIYLAIRRIFQSLHY